MKFNEAESDFCSIKTGVPQGSVLGPLLFLMYLNDLNNSNDIFKLICYADDSTLAAFLCFKNKPLKCKKCEYNNKYSDTFLNENLALVHEWLCLNSLSINIKKTKFMMFYNSQRKLPETEIPNLCINNEKIKLVEKFDFLGITFDTSLNWKPHVDKIASKISKSIGVLNRIKTYVPKPILKTIYHSLITPYLYYGILVWGFNNTRLLNLQKKAIRIITFSYFLQHTDILFKQEKILKINDILNLQSIIFFKKFLNDSLPIAINDILKKRNTRQIHLPQT